MSIRRCPLCQGEDFYYVQFTGGGQISTGLFKSIPVHGLVCLGCGFVTSSVDQNGLVALREKARSEGHGIGEGAAKPEFTEL